MERTIRRPHLPADQVAIGFRFGVLELDIEAGEPRKDGRLTRIRNQPLKVLAILLARPGAWFHRHARMLAEVSAGLPPGLSVTATFWFLTIPAVIFSPTAEEILFRGYLQRALTERYSVSRAVGGQAAVFAVIHLAHYGVWPWQPGLVPVWLLSMFSMGWLLGWIRYRSDSLWPAMVALAPSTL